MLNIFYGDMLGAIYNPALFFKNSYTDEWITNELSREMIKDVDRSVVLSPRVIDSPVLGGISPRELSGGVKTLICVYQMPEKVFNASACGDNCAKWLICQGCTGIRQLLCDRDEGGDSKPALQRGGNLWDSRIRKICHA